MGLYNLTEVQDLGLVF